MESSEPMALVLASQEDVFSHGHVLYGLVKQGKDEDSVESTSRMVNVVPRKRIYCMDSVDELIEFREELLKRPLVIQPVIQAGTGIQSLDCFFCVKKEPWIVMVNQFHQKIMSKISLGMDMAKRCMFRGEPYVLEFAFGDILKKHYYGNISKFMSSKYAYTDCEYGDIIIKSSHNTSFGNKVVQFKFSFEDVRADEIKVRTIEEAAKEKRSPVLEFIPLSELKETLPNWVFDEVEVEESITSTSDYHSDTNSGATGGDVVTSQPRIKGRSQRNSVGKRYEVPVELHVPDDVPVELHVPNDFPLELRVPYDVCDNGHEVRDTQYGIDSDHEYEIGRYRHFHQGSGRSDSSTTDSGYGENIGHCDKAPLHNNGKQWTKFKNNNVNKQNNYDNYAFDVEDNDDIYNGKQYHKAIVDTIITRTGKKTLMSLDGESMSARMMEDSVL